MAATQTTQPSKEQVREYMAAHWAKREKPQPIEEVRRALGWFLIPSK